jgi:TolA-binding protein
MDLMGRCHASMEEYGKAARAFRGVIERFPRYAYLLGDAQYQLGVSHVQRGAREEAVLAFRSLVADVPFARARLRADAHYQLGAADLDAGQAHLAREQLLRALKLGTGHEEHCRFLLGIAYDGAGHPGQAEKTLRRFVARYPESSFREQAEDYLQRARGHRGRREDSGR